MTETKPQNCRRLDLQKKIDSARNLNKLRRMKTDTVAEVKPQQKERRPTAMGNAVMEAAARKAMPPLRRGSSFDPASYALMEADTMMAPKLYRAGSLDAAEMALRLAEVKQSKKKEMKKSMKEMDPSKIISMLETMDSKQADECFKVLKHSKPTRMLPKRSKSARSARYAPTA